MSGSTPLSEQEGQAFEESFSFVHLVVASFNVVNIIEYLLYARPLLGTGNSKVNKGTFCPRGTSHQAGTRNNGTPQEKDAQLLHPPSPPQTYLQIPCSLPTPGAP